MSEVCGVIMAGGRAERMRATNGDLHKSLVVVDGRPLIEHNLRLLFKHGIDRIFVVSSENEPAIARWVDDAGVRVAAAFGGRVESYFERQPLGNIGVAAELSAPGTDLVVLYVDNLCPLDLRAMLARHAEADAAFTIATHLYALRNAFGELSIDGGRITGYREKPVRSVPISSGTCVVGPAAARLIPPGRPFGATDLFAEASRCGLTVAAFEHSEPWIDVNDRTALDAARDLVRANAERFA